MKKSLFSPLNLFLPHFFVLKQKSLLLGSFKDGCYDGELYIMTIEKNGNTTDWEATAQKGVFDYFHNRYSTTGKLPVWKRMEEIEEGTQYLWLDEPENVNWGISGLKKMN